MKIKALISTGLGFNCEDESAKAFELAGAESRIVDIRDILSGHVNIFDYHAIMLIGGFSYGDDLGSGKAVSNLLRFKKIRGKRFIDLIKKFVLKKKRVVMGVCNGFQVLIRLGILPGIDGNFEYQSTTLALNDSGQFEDRWVNIKINKDSPCIATRNISRMYLPVRHGEGKIIFADDIKDTIHGHVFSQYIHKNKPTTQYPYNPNGSMMSIAGLCDRTGRIFGMMPHPEAYLLFENHPHWTKQKRNLEEQGQNVPRYGQGLQIFKNIVDYCEKNCRR